MAITITLAIIAIVATYGALRPNELWFQHYQGRVAQARKASPGEAEYALRRRTYLVTALVCWLLAALSVVTLWHGSQPVGPS